MSITNYVKGCTKIIAGNDNKLFLLPVANMDTLAITANEITAIALEATADGFSIIEADLDSVGYTSTGVAARGFFSEQSLVMQFSKKSTTLMTLVDELRANAGCGIIAIRRDGAGNYFLSGYAAVDEMAGNRPYDSVQADFNSGASIEETEEGNMYIVTLSRKSATEEYLLDSILSGTIDDGTAAFIEWPV
jgi:hypothetical protein